VQGSSTRLGSMQAQPRPPPTHSHPRRALAASSKASMGKGGQGRPYCVHASTPAPPRTPPHACMHPCVLSCGRTVATRGTCMHTHELHKREGPQTPAPPPLPLAPYGAPLDLWRAGLLQASTDSVQPSVNPHGLLKEGGALVGSTRLLGLPGQEREHSSHPQGSNASRAHPPTHPPLPWS